jgi:HEAT repeat protein
MRAAAALALLLCASGEAADLRELQARLRDKDDRARAEAIEELGRLGSDEAFGLVLEGFKDPSSRVQDAAEAALGSARSPAVLEALVGKRGLGDSDAWTVRHALGAIARLEVPVEPGAFDAALSHKDASARFAACHAVEQLAQRRGIAGKPDKLAKSLERLAAKDPDLEVRAAALVAHARLVARLPADAARLVAEGPTPVACAALWLQAHELREAALPLLRAGLARKERSVRAACIDHLAALGTREAALCLVDALASESNPADLWRAADALERLSGVAFGDKIDLWKQWAANLPADWTPQAKPARATQRTGTGTAVISGLPILSTRVAVLVDLSGSVWKERPDGTTPKQDLEGELARMLDGFKPATRFQIVPFTEDPAALSKGLVEATPQAVAKAKVDFAALKTSGKGDYWDAIEKALADPEVDTIIVYGDGAPSGGRRWDVARMERDYLARDRFRRVRLSAVLVGAGRTLTERWTSWCEATGGRVEAVARR